MVINLNYEKIQFASIAADYKWSVYLRPLPEDQDEVKRLWSEV